MQSLKTLYFPDTAIISPRQSVLALLFNQITCVELIDNSAETDAHGDTFMNSTFCTSIPLHPLAEERDRFLYLINDLKNRKDDYSAQLSSLTLASLSTSQNSGDSSRHSIISSLLGNDPGDPVDEENRQKNEIWHARLILQLAETLDREEQEVAQALTALQTSEADVLDTLKGEDDEGNSLFASLTPYSGEATPPSASSISTRMKAWYRFIIGNSLEEFTTMSTSRPDAAAILLENHLNHHTRDPECIARFVLPATIGDNTAEVIAVLEQFHDAHGEFLDGIWTAIDDSTAAEDVYIKELCDRLQESITRFFPVEKFGRSKAEMFRFESSLLNYFDHHRTTLPGPKILVVASA